MSELEEKLKIEFEKIVPWNGAFDTGKHAREKLDRNFSKITSLFNYFFNMFIRKDCADFTEFLVQFFAGLEAGLWEK